MHDVYAYGVIAASTLVVLADDHPPSGGYAEITGVHPSLGGEAAGGAYVLARLGVPTKLAGNRLGDDESSARMLRSIAAAGVDCRAIERAADTPPVSEIVLSTPGARTVLGTYRRLLASGAWNAPSEDDIRASRIVCLDPFFAEASLAAARSCSEADVPYVTVDVKPDSEIGQHAGVVIVSEEFAGREIGSVDPRELLAAYTARCRGLVILTYGAERLVFGRRGERGREFTPFAVDALDTTGAGDSFRAGVIYEMLQGGDDAALVTTGSAVAALVCRRVPGVMGSPSVGELSAFLADRR